MRALQGKKAVIAMAVAICLLALVAVLVARSSGSKSAAMSYVQENMSELETYVQGIDADEGVYYDTYDGWDVTYYQNTGVVEFLASARGLGSASQYSGFYYSPQNVPVGFQGAELELVAGDSGWQWSESGGDNHYYTERIADNWYWFEMGF